MDGYKPVSKAQAAAARDALLKEFNVTALPVTGIKLEGDSSYWLMVVLSRPVTCEEEALLPQDKNGVSIAYDIKPKLG